MSNVKCIISQVLYRKYRPRTFGEVYGQEHVVRTLEGAILSGRIGHAYLFTGPRGTGKTTMARLFAKAINCANFSKISKGNFSQKLSIRRSFSEGGQLICNKCHTCNEINDNKFIDLIEIDAASNRGIDEIRNIKESAQVASSMGGWKVFIIDEVHMLTQQAFNALLKVLEEPPAHVVFILATTEPHKVIETILSRVQRFDFKRLAPDQLIAKLDKIAKKEKIVIDKESIESVAGYASGSLRDAENALAKLAAYTDGKISVKDTSEILGIIPVNISKNLLDALGRKDALSAIGTLNDIVGAGLDIENFAAQFVNYLRGELLLMFNNPGAETGTDPAFLADIIKTFIRAKSELKMSPIPQLPLELAVIELTAKKTPNT